MTISDQNSTQSIEELRSELISNLYLESNSSDLGKTLSRMKLLLNPVFVQPLLDCYRKHKVEDSGIKSSILELLSNFESPQILEFSIQEIKELNSTESIRHFFSILRKHSYYSDEIENQVIKELQDFFQNQNILLYYPIGRDIAYFLNANNRLHTIFSLLWENLINNPNIGDVMTGIILSDLFDSDKDKAIDKILNNFDQKIRGTSLEIAIAKQVKTDHSYEQLRKLLIEKGNVEAKLIVTEGSEDYYKVGGSYPILQFDIEKVETVYEIASIRREINTKVAVKTGEAIFQVDDDILSQAKKVSSESELVNLMIKLRDYISAINTNLVINLTGKEIEKLLPRSLPQDLNKPLNRLVLFINQPSIGIPDRLAEMKKIYRMTTLIGSHQKSDNEKRKILTQLGLLSFYERKQFSKLHLEIIRKYRDSLQRLNWRIA